MPEVNEVEAKSPQSVQGDKVDTIITSVMLSIFLIVFIGGFVYSKIEGARTSQAYELRMQENAVRDLDDSLRGSLTREQAEHEIATASPVGFIVTDTPELEGCQAVSWTFPAGLLATMEHVGTDSKGVDRYEVWYGSKGLDSPEVINYMAEHPELKPVPTPISCDDVSVLPEATIEEFGSHMWIQPQATGTLMDEAK